MAQIGPAAVASVSSARRTWPRSWARRCSRSLIRDADGWTAAPASTQHDATLRPDAERPAVAVGETELRGAQQDAAGGECRAPPRW